MISLFAIKMYSLLPLYRQAVYTFFFVLCFVSLPTVKGANLQKENSKADYLEQVGKSVTLKVKPVEHSQRGQGPHLLNVGGRFPNQSVSLVIWKKSLSRKFPEDFHPKSLVNMSFEVSGKISEYKGQPQIVIFGPDQLSGVSALKPKPLNDVPSGTFELLLNSPISAELKTSTESAIGKALLDLIDSTEDTLDMAVYGVRHQPEIYDAVSRAKNRGVIVRLVTDRTIDGKNYYSSTEEFEDMVGNVITDIETDLKTAEMYKPEFEPFWPSPDGFNGPPQSLGYTIGRDRAIIAVHASKDPFPFQGDIMHNKFAISDLQHVWTGSCNLSDSGTGGYNANIACVINSPQIATQFTEEFERMYSNGLFHRDKETYRENDRITKLLRGKNLYVGFCPQDHVVQESLIPAIKGADASIDVAIFFLTHKYITAELIKAHLRGVKVRIIIDATSVSNGYTKHKILREVGIPVKVENWGGKMHMKAACIDGYKLVLGSMNWTSAGERQNDENYLLLESTLDSLEFTRFFQKLWDSIPERCLVDDPDPESLASPGSTTDGADNDFDKLVDDDDPGATQFLYNSQPIPPQGFATISSGFGMINGKKIDLILGVSKRIKGRKKMFYVLPNHDEYSELKDVAEKFFSSIWEAKESGYENSYRN